MPEIIARISSDVQIPSVVVRRAVELARYRCRRFSIQKKDGGKRWIVQPSVKVKPILSWLSGNVFSALPVHDSATAFRRGRSILDNASAHKDALYSVRVDLKNFFPSIRSVDIWRVMISSRKLLPEWAIAQDALQLILKVCFDQNDQLPIGYSTSPEIANAVMFDIDSKIAASISDESRFGAALVTRYADDFVFSTNLKGACKRFVELLGEILNATDSPKLEINVDKTRYMSRGGGSTIITGLRVNNAGFVVVHGKYRDHVRLLLKLYESNRLAREEVPKLMGHLAYIEHVDPALFTKLSFKYYKQVARLRLPMPPASENLLPS